ncbi:hypothetical protein B0H14DRAFT_2673640, partial [Mycena olivaceomarginata]
TTHSDTQPRGTLRYRLLSTSLRPAGSPLADPPEVMNMSATLPPNLEMNTHSLRQRRMCSMPKSTPAPETRKEEVPAEPKIIGTIEDLRALAKECTVFLIGYNTESDAVDLLEDLEIVGETAHLVDDNTLR